MDYIIALSKSKRKHTDDQDDNESDSEASGSDDGEGLKEVGDASSEDENFMSNFMDTE